MLLCTEFENWYNTWRPHVILKGFGAEASLVNNANLYVEGAPHGHNFDGWIDFMGTARGTLANSRTTIEKLYAWEFDGSFL
jgi:hypothetical protein